MWGGNFFDGGGVGDEVWLGLLARASVGDGFLGIATVKGSWWVRVPFVWRRV